MALSYGTVKYGSSGDDVKELQRRLNSAGYSVAVDGSYGEQTRNAVQDYQKKNNLTVDGIVGSETWGSLLGSINAPQGFGEAQTAGGSYAGTGKPGTYESQNRAQMDALYDQIVGRKPFQFDLDGNGLYQQYKDQYVSLGKMAMEDTMGQAAGLTGGYGSSYAQGAGQQAYNQYLQQLGTIVPDIYAQERAAYDQEGAALADRYAMLADEEDRDYSRWADDYSRWFAEKQAAQDQANWDRQFAYTTSRGSGGSGGGRAAADETGELVIADRLYGLAEQWIASGADVSSISEFLESEYPNTKGEELYDLFYDICMETLADQRKNGVQDRYTGHSVWMD
jgi:peptidoglycan hydrolase-like protein with peptidoglycan-binding domain